MTVAIHTNEADWIVQLARMQEALAALPPRDSDAPPGAVYGGGLDLSDEDFSVESESDGIFDFSEGSGSYDSHSEYEGEDVFDDKWLTRKCRRYCARKFAGQAADELAENILAVLRSDRRDDELQMSLADILGYEDEDLVMASELIRHRAEITFEEPQAYGGGEDAILRLMSKEQRDDAFRQADLDHKSRPLGTKLAGKEVEYPHIYRAYAAGDTLSSFGKKYSLPKGSKEIEEKEYTEIKIPPTKVGTVGVNEKLVVIKSMDRLCQKTFVGYKSLNRMQSLLYPVAYGKNENMLICAPTGAVRTPLLLAS